MHELEIHLSNLFSGSSTIEDFGSVHPLIASARNNRVRVLEASLVVESCLRDVIAIHFFGLKHDRKSEFQSWILDSDWCSFAAKRKLINFIINERELLEGSEKNKFDGLLSRVMKTRNAFAHGKFIKEEERVYLKYFDQKEVSQELSDEYLRDIQNLLEGTVFESRNLVHSILRRILREHEES